MTSGTARTPRKETGTRARVTAETVTGAETKTGPDGSRPDDDEVAKLKARVTELEKRLKVVERKLDTSRRENLRLREEQEELRQREANEDELQRILALTDEGERARRLAQLSSEERTLYVKLRMDTR
ncbi:hypothetical protein [Streptomyces phaeochromogenes]|uniref:hypothetical protein n=1 Tax=Streptomyces phaeochromogenes TaxID=1923 RepID=UPI00368074EF